MEANGVNYYKGVLLCSRPNESPSIEKQKPFCGRVTPHEQIGLVPTKNFDQPKTRKRQLPVLNNHKKWLKSFKEKIQTDKQKQQQLKQQEIRRLQKIKQEGARKRETAKNSESTSVAQAQQEKSQKQAKQATRMKKGKKPVWAKTDQEIEQQQEKEADELIDFFESGEVKDYADDEEIKKMLQDLKGRIEVIKSEGGENGDEKNWKKRQVEKIKEQKKLKEESEKSKNDDVLSHISRESGGLSVSSQKTAERVEQLEKKKNEKQWDKYTTSSKKTANIDEQIAKNVADEVLRNYPALKHHSNQSIRKLLEQQAHMQIQS